ncbi:MAG TPA: ribosome-binding factor A [Elusimicrobia bacterium]|nr:MAG: hypothetical protein A2016_10570 [Elusimicrobia bacterium GWF2_62_30]HBA60656.1 ribosome-binding factor A [Elusimicrobiota bacterium]
MSKRHQRLTGLFIQEITLALRNVHGLNDKGLLTITGADLSRDDKTLDVFYSVLGTPEEQARKQRILTANSREIRTILFKRLRLKSVPEISFKFDETPQKAAHIEKLLDNLRSEHDTTDENTRP